MNLTCRSRPPATPRIWFIPRFLLLMAVLARLAALGVSAAEDRQVRQEAARTRVVAERQEWIFVAGVAAVALAYIVTRLVRRGDGGS
ncbi:MAG: hypothetical protein HUU15_13410 [Candidatus Brocadiae bacterium]|nr:hypothetical protein [Candidatus Brocadiia bacterium]